MSAATIAMLASVAGLTSWPAPAPARALPPGLKREASGLAMADELQRHLTPGQLEDSYALDGSAGPRLGWAFERPSGLYVGIKAHKGWAGWFASTVHAAGPDVAWHTRMSAAVAASGSRRRVLGVFAVQTATTQTSGAINYVVVAQVAKGRTYHWVVGYAHGVVAGASTELLWSSRPQRIRRSWRWLPGREVTVVTDGHSRLSVWLGRDRVFSSSHLELHIPPPFQAYLEVQSRAPAFEARFTDFWVASTAPLRVTELPPGTLVTLDGQWDARAAPNGVASLHLPPYALSGRAVLTIGAQRYPEISYSGGDILRPTR